jgi:hypothetical protein
MVSLILPKTIPHALNRDNHVPAILNCEMHMHPPGAKKRLSSGAHLLVGSQTVFRSLVLVVVPTGSSALRRRFIYQSDDIQAWTASVKEVLGFEKLDA